ncbi:MAG: hypothetical protein ACTHOU_21810 [Aureliella sp.]
MIPQISVLPPTCLGRIVLLAALICLGWGATGSGSANAQATMTIDIVDEKTGQPIPCRVELRDAKGRPQKTRGGLNRPPWSIVDGQFVYRGRQGDYKFDVSHGPEFAGGGGGFTLDRDGEGTDVVRLPRYANMAEEGWFAGDLLAFLPPEDITRWLSAEGLQMAAAIGPPAGSAAQPAQPDGRWCDAAGYYDDRPGSGLVLHNWQPPAAVPDKVPSSRLLVMAKENAQTHAEIARLWSRDAPVWLASGRIDSIQILSEHTTRDGRSDFKVSQMFHPEPNLYKGARGAGRLVENLYWQVLETGLRIPPSAGSGVGRSTSPLGYNRVYVWQDSATNTPAAWWDGLRAGRSFVTNGPLLRATVNTQLPGHVFRISGGQKLMLDVAVTLTVADPVEYVDVVFNGDAIYHARLDEYAKQGGKIPALEIADSGWLVIRVVTQREETYRLATTAPYYVEVDGRPRINGYACQMFVDWLEASVAEQQKADPAAAGAAAPYTTAALQFWRERLAAATINQPSY